MRSMINLFAGMIVKSKILLSGAISSTLSKTCFSSSSCVILDFINIFTYQVGGHGEGFSCYRFPPRLALRRTLCARCLMNILYHV